MNLDDIINILAEKPHYLFNISVPGIILNHSKKSVQSAIENAGSLQAYFDKIIKANNAKKITVELFTTNGTSFKNRGKHLIFLAQPEHVATNCNTQQHDAIQSNTKQHTATNSAINTNEPLHGINDTQQQVKTPSMNPTDQLGYAVLQVKHEMITNQKNSLEAEVKELRKKVDLLHEEKLALVKENTVSGERNKLETDKAIFNIQKEGKDGLSGFMGELNDNPETLKMIIGLFKPDHPMFKEEGVAGTKLIEAPVFHTDKDVNAMLADLPNTIKAMDPAVIARIYYIFLEGFAKDPAKVESVFTMLFPDAPKQ